MIRLIFSIGIIVALGAAFVYLAPNSLKEKTLTFIESKDIIPDVVKKKAEELLGTPHYRREQLITSLEKNLSDLRSSLQTSATSTTLSPAEQLTIVENSEKILSELKVHNEDTSLTDSTIQSIISKILKEDSAICATTTPK